MGEMVHLRLDSKMRKAIKSIVKDRLYSTETEFIRDSIRKNLELNEKLVALKALQGSVPRRKTPPKKIPSDIFRAYGFE
ncbi:hypothetical protein GOV11_01660 [Candidatus Woesearchaeota archaeon]|nr:hypothetical protein [Candidatus Woesearchaeota archaeon]